MTLSQLQVIPSEKQKQKQKPLWASSFQGTLDGKINVLKFLVSLTL